MIVPCPYDCGTEFDDEFRSTLCPHDTFLANDAVALRGSVPPARLRAP